MTHKVTIKRVNDLEVASVTIYTNCSEAILNTKMSMEEEIKGIGEVSSVTVEGITILTGIIR